MKKIIKALLRVVQTMNKYNICHRDIKPANIMVNFFLKKPIIKLIDFGLCADYTDSSGDSLLYDKSGTAGYIAPEILGLELTGKLYNQKVDIYSIGVILYEMVVGFNPFKSRKYEDSLLKNYYS